CCREQHVSHTEKKDWAVVASEPAPASVPVSNARGRWVIARAGQPDRFAEAAKSHFPLSILGHIGPQLLASLQEGRRAQLEKRGEDPDDEAALHTQLHPNAERLGIR